MMSTSKRVTALYLSFCSVHSSELACTPTQVDPNKAENLDTGTCLSCVIRSSSPSTILLVIVGASPCAKLCNARDSYRPARGIVVVLVLLSFEVSITNTAFTDTLSNLTTFARQQQSVSVPDPEMTPPIEKPTAEKGVFDHAAVSADSVECAEVGW